MNKTALFTHLSLITLIVILWNPTSFACEKHAKLKKTQAPQKKEIITDKQK